MDIGEGMCGNEYWVLYKIEESQTCNSGTNNTLYINLKKKNKRKRNTNSKR